MMKREATIAEQSKTREAASRDALPSSAPDGQGAGGGRRGRLGSVGSVRLTWLVIFIACLALPAFSNGYILRVLSVGWLYAILAMGVVITYGFAGIPNMSQATIYGIGAYVAANLMFHLQLNYILVLLVSAASGAAVGGLLGLTTLRVKGAYWWLITIAFTEVLDIVFNSWKPVTGGPGGFVGIPIASIADHPLVSLVDNYYLALVVLIICYALYARWSSSRIGLATAAVREDEIVARGLGLSAGALRVTAMVLAGFGAGLAGACLDSVTGFIDATSFSLLFSFSILLFAVVGGLRSLRGAIVATVSLTAITTQVTSLVTYQLLIYGSVVLVALLLRLYRRELGILIRRVQSKGNLVLHLRFGQAGAPVTGGDR